MYTIHGRPRVVDLRDEPPVATADRADRSNRNESTARKAP
jgi:hypothetical protein